MKDPDRDFDGNRSGPDTGKQGCQVGSSPKYVNCRGLTLPELQVGVNFVILTLLLNHIFTKRPHKVLALCLLSCAAAQCCF